MTWIKPNFLWMMYRSGWGTKPGQQRTLAIALPKDLFVDILHAAVHTSHVTEVYGTHDAWQAALKASEVRLQWDPDHSPSGGKLTRRAIQLGLKGALARRLATESLWIEDISGLVAEQRQHLQDLSNLTTPRETVFPVADLGLAKKLGVLL